jgi:hypothetical protein
MDTNNFVGGSWLQARYGINLVMPLTVLSRIGGRRTTQEVGGIRTETFVEGMRPPVSFQGFSRRDNYPDTGGILSPSVSIDLAA